MKYLSKILLLFALASCTAKLADKEGSNMLYYCGVSEISPGTPLSVSPSWYGEKPSGFTISAITFEGQPFVSDCFVVDAETGVFQIVGSEQLSTGHYCVSIACNFGASRKEFTNAIEVHLMKPVPDGIVVTPATLAIPLGNILEDGEVLPTADIASDGSDHVTIKKISIANVRRDGELVNECKEWFAVSDGGVFSVVAPNAEFIPGTYSFDFRLVTYIVGQEDEAGLFANALTVDVTSKPLSIIYPTAETKVECGYAAFSPAPQMTGSLSGLSYAIKAVQPSNVPGITVNETNGVLTFPVTDAVNVGDQFVVSLTVTNDWGSADFDDIYTFFVIDYIHPVTQLSYADVDELISGLAFSNPVTACDGDEVEYAFVDLPEGLSGLSIDQYNGTVSCAKGVELVPGSYQVKVSATNVKSTLTASFALTVIANPYNFTYVRWGNNLWPDDEQKCRNPEYGNQFRLTEGEIKVPILESDIPDGVPVKFVIKNSTNLSTMNTGAAINSATGELTLTYKGNQTANQSARTHGSVITVTVGGDSPAAVTRKFPLFVAHDGYINGYKISYTPFAFRVNPKTGGRSAAPVITRQDGGEVSGFTLSYRRNVFYYNVDGPEEHIDGRAQDGTDRFMYTVWKKYFDARNVPVNTGSPSPVSWYGDNNGEKGWLPFTACYNDPADLSIVVNPEKFSDDYGYGSGFISGQVQYNINNANPVNAGTQCYPFIIWLDPSYNN